MRPSISPQKLKPISWWAVFPGLALTFFFLIIILIEWINIGVMADPTIIASYHFGSEAMIGEGGPHYQSAESYAQSALINCLLLSPACFAFIKASIKRTAMRTVIAYGSLVLSLITVQIFNAL